MTKKKKEETEKKGRKQEAAEEQPAPAEAEIGAAPEPSPGDTVAEEPVSRDRLMRLQADFDNFRKRTQKERGEWYQQANEHLMLELLPVLDHFDLGIKTAVDHDADASVVDGFKMVQSQLLGALKKFGLEPVDAESQPFDPHLHEAVTHLASEEHPEDTVMAQTRRGYRLGSKLLRPAQVVVSSGPAEEDTDATGDNGTDEES
jgi:molecular chaperone GrpE